MNQEKIKAIYVAEMTRRMLQLGQILEKWSGDSVVVTPPSAELYNAHLHAHNLKGTSEQLAFTNVAELASVMSSLLARSRDVGQVTKAETVMLDQGRKAVLAWLQSNLDDERPLKSALGAFEVAGALSE